METGTKIFIGLGLGAVITTLIVFGVKSSKKPKDQPKPDDSLKPADAGDFDLLYNSFNRSGADIFSGASDTLKEQMKNLLIRNLTKGDVKKLVAIINKGERNWTTADKNDFSVIFNKWKKGFVTNVGQR